MKKRTEAWARLSAYVEAGDFDDRFLSLVAEGEDPTRLSSRVFGVPWYVMKAWLESDAELAGRYEQARRAGADRLMYDALEEVRGADEETVQLAKLRADRFDRMAGKLDRRAWGDKVEVEIGVAPDIRGLLAQREAKLMGVAERVVEMLPLQPGTVDKEEIGELI